MMGPRLAMSAAGGMGRRDSENHAGNILSPDLFIYSFVNIRLVQLLFNLTLSTNQLILFYE